MRTVEFPSAEAAYDFAVDARALGYKVTLDDAAQPVTKRAFWTAVVAALVGGTVFGLVGALAEAGLIGLPRLEPLFAAPVGSVTTLLSIFGGSLGALLGGLAALKPVTPRLLAAHYVSVAGGEKDSVGSLAGRYGGGLVERRKWACNFRHLPRTRGAS